MGLALARENGGLGVFTLHAFNELLSSDSPTVTYKAHIPTLLMHVCAPHCHLEPPHPPFHPCQSSNIFTPNMVSLIPGSPIWVKVK